MNGVKILPNGMVQLPDGSVVSKEAFERILQGYKPIGGTPVGTERPVGPPIPTTTSPASPQKPLDYMPTMTRPSRYDLLERNPNGMGGKIPPAAPTPEAMPERPTGQRYDMNRLRGRDLSADMPPKSPEAEGRGLLDILLSANQKEEKPGFDWRMAGAGLLSMSPSEGMQRIGAMGMEQAGELRKEERALKRSNRTVDALVASGMIKPSQAEALRSNPELISEFYKAALKGDDATIAKYKWLLANPDKAAQLKNMGAIGSSGNTFTIDMGKGPEKLRENLYGGEGDLWSSYVAAGSASVGLMGDIALLEQAAMAAPNGPVVGRLLEVFPEANDNAAVFNAIVQRVAPTLRVEGSGSTSDIEFEGMIKSLGSLRNSPQANAMIYEAFKAKAQLNIERANVVRAYQNEEMTEQQARDKLYEIDSRSVLPAELKNVVQAADTTGVPESYASYYQQLPPERQQIFKQLSEADQKRLFDAWFQSKVGK